MAQSLLCVRAAHFFSVVFESYCVALTGLVVAIQTRVALNSQRFIYILSAGIITCATMPNQGSSLLRIVVQVRGHAGLFLAL